MILIFRQADPNSRECRAIALFGTGLVGGAIFDALRQRGDADFVELPLDWNDPSRRAFDLEDLTGALLSHRKVVDIRTLDTVWAAGRAGFGTGRDELSQEIASFKDVLKWTESVSSRLGAKTSFHFLSSAGGLFEGQRFVECSSRPQPLRAYGESKLEQEKLLGSIGNGIAAQIYRPSSIYGFNGRGGRSGLINTLILNAKRQSVSRIFGELDTVRDYVLAADVGRFIAARIIDSDARSSTFLLASGKPASVNEIVRLVSKVMGSKLYLKLDVYPSNASHIAFRPSVLPGNSWRPTDLETGIRLVLRQLSKTFETGAGRVSQKSIAPANGR